MRQVDLEEAIADRSGSDFWPSLPLGVTREQVAADRALFDRITAELKEAA